MAALIIILIIIISGVISFDNAMRTIAAHGVLENLYRLAHEKNSAEIRRFATLPFGAIYVKITPDKRNNPIDETCFDIVIIHKVFDFNKSKTIEIIKDNY